MSNLLSYHPPLRTEILPGLAVLVRPETEVPYTFDECDGVIKMTLRDADGFIWSPPKAIWFQFENTWTPEQSSIVNWAKLMEVWLDHWVALMPMYAKVEEVLVKTALERPFYPRPATSMRHGRLFHIQQHPCIWGVLPSDYPETPYNLKHIAASLPNVTKEFNDCFAAWTVPKDPK